MNNAKESLVQKATVPTTQQANKKKRPAVDPIILKALAHEVRGLNKSPSPFSFQSEIQKLRIPIPLIEVVKNDSFKRSILEALELKAIQASTDYVNLQDDKPAIILSPSFYVSLTIHDKILHNSLLDIGASHNLMPKAIMDELGLEITKPYHDLFSFDSIKVKCLGLIKDLSITLSQLPMKSMMMDIVVADVPPKFGMLLSRGWIKILGGTLQNDLSYAIVPVLEMRVGDYTEKLSWLISSVIKGIPLIIPSMLSTLTLEPVFFRLKNPI